MTTQEKIMATKAYQSGNDFDWRDISAELNMPRDNLRPALGYLVSNGLLLVRPERKYCAPPPKHWIHSARLNDAQSLHQARMSAA